MKSFIVVLILTLCISIVAMAEGPAQLMGSVEAVYHEGLMTFRVAHADAVSISIKVYDLETDAVVYDSGPRAQTLVSWPAGYDVTGSFRYVVTAWNDQGEVVVSQAAVTKSLTPIAAISFDTIPGNTKLLGPNEVIVESDLQVGATQGVRIDQVWGTSGGAVNWYEENGSTTHTRIEPDGSGEGGYLYVDGTVASGSYVRISGQSAGNQADLYVQGTSDFAVYAGNTGDGSVVMPASSVGSAEMGNEPGVASSSSGASSTITTTAAYKLLRTISAPTAGYVVASAAVDLQMVHTSGTNTYVQCGISQSSTSIPSDGDMTTGLPSGAASGTYNLPAVMTRTFVVPAGSDTFYVVCQKGTGGTASTFDRHFNLRYFPTAYGSVTESTENLDGHMEGVDGYVSPYTGGTQAEIDAEKAESIAFNIERIQAELAALQAQADALANADADPNQD